MAQAKRNFNSIKVRLELNYFLFFVKRLFHFNSIKVRLEPADRVFVSPTEKFQFHKGAIRTLIMTNL